MTQPVDPEIRAIYYLALKMDLFVVDPSIPGDRAVWLRDSGAAKAIIINGTKHSTRREILHKMVDKLWTHA